MACSSGCRTKDHKSYGACLKSKGIQIEGVEAHDVNRKIRSDVEEYVDARREGIQPESISLKDTMMARRITEATGVPYRADEVA